MASPIFSQKAHMHAPLHTPTLLQWIRLMSNLNLISALETGPHAAICHGF
jgi:hypothetical protein